MTARLPVFDFEPGLKRNLKISFIIHSIFLIILLFLPNTGGRIIKQEGVYRVSLKSMPVNVSVPQSTGPSGTTSMPVERKVAIPSNEGAKPTTPAKKELAEKGKDKIIPDSKKNKKEKTKKEERREKDIGEEDILAMLSSARKELSGKGASTGEGKKPLSGEENIITGALLSGSAKNYYDHVEQKIKNEWILPGALAQEAKKLKTVIGIVIQRDGTIEDIWIEQSSGNIYYDRAALRAVKKANPLPPLPPEMPDKKLEIGIIF